GDHRSALRVRLRDRRRHGGRLPGWNQAAHPHAVEERGSRSRGRRTMTMDGTLLLQLVLSGLIVGALYGVVAMCFVLIYKARQVVNFAQGEFMLIGAWACWWLLVRFQLPFFAGFLITLVFMMAFGLILQVVVLKPL